MTQADTPDYQRGVVSAQKLLATVPDTETSVTVGIPPNAETIVVLAPGSLNPADFTCQGATSGLDYPPVPYGPSETGANTTSIVFDVSAAVDSSVTITYGFAAAFVWYVYSDSAAHVHTNAYLARTQNQAGNAAPVDALQVGGTDGTDLRAIRTDTNGQQFAVPAAPGTGGSDHPLTELSLNAITQAAPLSAPGVGLRYRLFAIYPNPQAAGDAFYMSLNPAHGGGGGNYFAFGGATAAYARAPVVFPLSGLPLITNSEITLTDVTGTNNATVLYTIETA